MSTVYLYHVLVSVFLLHVSKCIMFIGVVVHCSCLYTVYVCVYVYCLCFTLWQYTCQSGVPPMLSFRLLVH